MDVATSLKPCIQVSQAFGLVSFELRQSNGGRVLCESARRLAYSKKLFAFLGFIQGGLLVKTAMEFSDGKGMLIARIIRMLHVMTFTATLASMYLTVIVKGGEICTAVNCISRLFSLLPKKKNCQKTLSRNRTLMLCVLAYFPTVFVSILHTIHKGNYQWFRVFRSSIFAINIWQENLFSSQFFIIANTFYAVVVGYNESLGCLPSSDSRRVNGYIQKMKSSDLLLKSAFHGINSVYKYNLLLGTVWFFIALIYFVLRGTNQVNFVFWALYVGFRMSSVLSVCDDIRKQVEKTAHHLHDLFIEFDNSALKEEVEIFSLQLMHRKAEFNACGFFKLDFSLLHSMIATVSTYIIILMQLQGDSNVVDCFKGHHCANCTV